MSAIILIGPGVLPVDIKLMSNANNLNSIRTPLALQDALRLVGATNTLLVTYWTSPACGPCHTIIPLLRSVISNRLPSPLDNFPKVALAELDLSSADTGGDAGFATMANLGVEYGVANIPTLMSIEPRRSERRLGTKVTDVKALSDKKFLEDWLHKEMSTEEPGNIGTGSVFGRLFRGSTS